MSVVSFALAVVFIIRLFSTSAFRVPNVIYNPEFLFHAFDDNLFVFACLLVFKIFMTVSTPRYRDRVSGETGGHVLQNFGHGGAE